VRHRCGFTLVELLVVIAIIVVLLALLSPAVDRAVDLAERAACAAKLHAWGIAARQYGLDHKNHVMSTVRNQGNNNGIQPVLVWGDNATQAGYDDVFPRTKAQDWSAESIQPYIPGDYRTQQYTDMWWCPAAKTELKLIAAKSTVTSPIGRWFSADYGYYARSDLWPSHATKPGEITGSVLESGRILMADSLYFYNPTGTATWWYNHGEDGYSVHDPSWGTHIQGPVPKLTGTNQLFGDGAVGWKGRSRFDPQAMYQRPLTERYTSSGAAGTAPDPGGNLNYW
jgi:prepilin-type N-terminal cleavage/methylation domain-containing protein